MRWEVDFGSEDDQRHLEDHLAERGLWLGDIDAVASDAIGRRKGDRMFLFGRAEDGRPTVVVTVDARGAWRPVTAWPMSLAERRWWRARGGNVGMDDLDRTLERESPVHDSVGWENVPPPLGAVLSVRFDMGVVGRLARLAGATGRTPSGLIRDWTLERLAALEGTEDSHVRRIREAPESYRADGPYEKLRARYRPPEVRLLLVGESRPAGGAFFYRANSRLFFAVREAFGRALGPMPAGEAFLTLFQRQGAWLYDMAASPVNRQRGRPRTAAVAARVGDLTRVLEDSPAAQVVAIKRDLEAPVRRAMDMARAPVDRLVVLPFPLYQWREVFVSGLAAVVIDMVSGRNKAPQPVRRKRETGSSATARMRARDE